MTPEERSASARAASLSRWRARPGLTVHQQRVLDKLRACPADSLSVTITNGPSGQRRRRAIEQLDADGLLRILARQPGSIAIGRAK